MLKKPNEIYIYMDEDPHPESLPDGIHVVDKIIVH